ncbi:hypothetical protein VTK26DRAFT_6258 [Humicola hyalothermophila]
MLGRKLTGNASFVCLRCRLQLAGTPRRLPFPTRFAAPPLRIPRRCIGTGAARPATEEHTSQQNGKSNAESSDTAKTEDTSEPTTGPDGEIAAPTRSYHIIRPRLTTQQSRLYKSKGGKLLTPKDEGLSIDILGQPGSAIVLREQDVMKQPFERPELEPQEAPEAQVDLSSFFQEKGTDATSDDILMNIHELKPQETRLLTEKEFTALKDKLLDGFTALQLESYIKEYQETLQVAEELETAQETPPWVLELRPWVPAVEKPVNGINPKLEGYITSGMSAKPKLAIRLMRECWDLSCQGVLDRDGHLILRVRDLEFSLLTIGSMRWLQGAPRAILQQVKEVRLVRESRLVSILAPKYAADMIYERMNRFLSSARTAEFPVDLVSPSPLEPSVLEEVGRATNTVTRFDPSGKQVVVTWAHRSERDENFENTGESVQRFLRDAFGTKPREYSALEIIPKALARQGRYLPEHDCGQKLPWHERSKKWERWAVAAPQSQSGSDTRPKDELPVIPASILPFVIGSGEAPKESESSSERMMSWSPEPQIETSAVFGHVVFARQGQTSAPSSRSEFASVVNPSRPRTFVPLLPTLKSLNLETNLREAGLWHTNVVIRFVPSLDMSPELVNSAPNLELSLEADHREIKAIRHLHAITDIFTGDVLLPGALVDTRFIQRRYFTLPGRTLELVTPQVITFLEKSDLRPWDGKLNTPPCLLGLRLPRRLFSHGDSNSTAATAAANGNNNKHNNNSTPGEGDNDLVEVNYTLASLEVQRAVSAEYEGFKLRYIDTQGGQRGGQRAEIALDAHRVEAKDVPNQQSQESYKIVAGDGERLDAIVWPQRTFDSSSDADRSAEETETAAKPVDPEEFMKVVANIIHENGRIKWQEW